MEANASCESFDLCSAFAKEPQKIPYLHKYIFVPFAWATGYWNSLFIVPRSQSPMYNPSSSRGSYLWILRKCVMHKLSVTLKLSPSFIAHIPPCKRYLILEDVISADLLNGLSLSLTLVRPVTLDIRLPSNCISLDTVLPPVESFRIRTCQLNLLLVVLYDEREKRYESCDTLIHEIKVAMVFF